MASRVVVPLAGEVVTDEDSRAIAQATSDDIDDLQTSADAASVDALTTQYCIPVPLGNFRIYSSGAAVPAWNDGVADGFNATAESIGITFNVGSTAKLAASVLMPNDLDDTAAVVVHVLGYRRTNRWRVFPNRGRRVLGRRRRGRRHHGIRCSYDCGFRDHAFDRPWRRPSLSLVPLADPGTHGGTRRG